MVDEVLGATGLEDVVLVGNSLGAAVALAAGSQAVKARVLVSPAGLVRLSLKPSVAFASAAWLLRPSISRTERLLAQFVGPGESPPTADLAWMTLMAATCRTTLAPPPLPPAVLRARAVQPCVVAVGEYDPFLPPARLARKVAASLGVKLRVIPGMGHLTTPPFLHHVVRLISEVADG